MSISAMKQALEALEWNYGTDLENIENCTAWLDKLNATIPALRQAIAEAEKQEPVAWRFQSAVGGWAYGKEPPIGSKYAVEPLYAAPVHASDISQERVDETAKDRHELAGTIPISNGGIATRTPSSFISPPKREWVGLSDKEVKKIVDKNTSDIWCNGKGVARDVEAKLKEKNT